jgi:hypothetical protein
VKKVEKNVDSPGASCIYYWESMKEALKPLPRRLQSRLDRCRQELAEAQIGLLGSVSERFMTCSTSGCHCRATPPQLHGPYYQWTTKIDGKTKTLRVGPEEVEHFHAWIAEGRRLERCVQEWRKLSLEVIQWRRDHG